MAWKKCLESKKYWNKKIEIRKERIAGSALTGAPFYGRENKRMRYEEFLKEIMGMLETRLGKSYQLEYGDIRKNNGIRRKGLVIKEQGEVVSPVFYLEEAYQKVNTGAKIELQESDSTTGMTAAIDGTCDIGMASRELKDSEKSAGLTNQVIALDGIAVIVNNKNSASNITSEQVKAIFTGETTDWSNVK